MGNTAKERENANRHEGPVSPAFLVLSSRSSIYMPLSLTCTTTKTLLLLLCNLGDGGSQGKVP